VLGTHLRELRLLAGLSQESLAERAGLSAATIAALEEGRRRRPYPNTVAALAHALGLAEADRLTLFQLARSSRAAAEPPEPLPAPPARGPRRSPRVALPVPPTTLIGRDAEVAFAVAALDPARSDVRLLTLLGPGGVGKTRLAIATATALADVFADGIAFV